MSQADASQIGFAYRQQLSAIMLQTSAQFASHHRAEFGWFLQLIGSLLGDRGIHRNDTIHLLRTLTSAYQMLCDNNHAVYVSVHKELHAQQGAQVERENKALAELHHLGNQLIHATTYRAELSHEMAEKGTALILYYLMLDRYIFSVSMYTSEKWVINAVLESVALRTRSRTIAYPSCCRMLAQSMESTTSMFGNVRTV